MPAERRGKQYEYPPTGDEVHRALRKQAKICFRFHADPTMTVEEYQAELEDALAPLKNSRRTEVYALEELALMALDPENKKAMILFKHENNHAEQIRRVLKAMGVRKKPEFLVYWCPIMADMYQAGNFVGLIESQTDLGLTREDLIESEERMALQMLTTTQNSIGDVYFIGAMMVAKVFSFVRGRQN